MEDIVQWK